MIIKKDDIERFSKEFGFTEKDSLNIFFYMKAQNITNNKLKYIEDYIREYEKLGFVADSIEDLKDYYSECSEEEVEEFIKHNTIKLENGRLFVY